MNIISVANPRWANASLTAIDLDVTFEGLGTVPFTASASATRGYSNALFANAVSGKYGAIAPTDPAVVAAEIVRETRRNEIAQAKADTKADAFVQQFVEMTPAQVTTYVNNNVANLADAKQLLTKLALMMLAIAKEQYK